MKTEDGIVVTSKDVYNAYLLISDEYSGYLWCFLVNSRYPPITIVQQVLNRHGNKYIPRYIRTDQGGELARSAAILNLIGAQNYVLKSTAPGSSFHNGVFEHNHRTLADMMWSMLHEANLRSEYCLYALCYAV